MLRLNPENAQKNYPPINQTLRTMGRDPFSMTLQMKVLLFAKANEGTDQDQDHSLSVGAPKKGRSKSQLYEICAANCWKPPLFECCKEEGPSHAKMFTYKVIVEIKEASTTVLECFGAPRMKKKEATEHAAEGALWYLKHIGFSPNDN
ncbi:hypothetical protein ACB094_05G077300 [Castanea mollissima]